MRKNMPLEFPYNVTMKELEKFVKDNPTVERWLRKYPETTSFEYSYALARFFKWLDMVKRIKLSPKKALNDHLQCLKSEDVTIRKKHLNWAFDFTRDNPDFRDYSDSRKKVLFSAISSFYAEYEVPLTRAKTVYGKVKRKYRPKQMTLDEAKKIIGSCKQREKTLLLIMLQSGMSIGDVLNKFNYKWNEIKPQLQQPRVKIELEGRKGHQEAYFTYISRDAIQELKKYIAKRGEPKEGEPIFISRVGKPLRRTVIYNALKSVYKKAGIRKEYQSYTTHMLRKLFKTEASPPERGIDRDVIEFMLGHKGGLDAVGAEYDKTPELYEEVIEREYEKLEPYINIFSPKPTVTEEAIAKAQIIQAVERAPKERRRQMLEQILEKLPYHLRESIGKDDGIIKILKRSSYKRANCDNENCQKIINESELKEHLAKGYRFIAILPSGKIVVED